MDDRANAKVGANKSTPGEIKKQNIDRKRSLLAETNNDPYLKIDSTGKYCCSLCKTLHPSVLNFSIHVKGKRHKKRLSMNNAKLTPESVLPVFTCRTLLHNGSKAYGIEVIYKNCEHKPTYRFVLSLEQNVEPYDERYMYLVIICAPFSNIGFKFEGTIDESSVIYESFDSKASRFRINFISSKNN